MSKFSKKNKALAISLLLFSTIIITNSCNFSNNQENVEESKVLNSIDSQEANESMDSDDSKHPIKLPNYVEVTIKYNFFPEIYNSKDELFKDFISYLYDYIVTHHAAKGIPHLKSLDINSVEDALRICKDWNENDGTGLPLVGKAFSPFFLYNNPGEGFKGQEDKDYFIGYCFKEKRFINFLYFLKTFFYHFRIDEGYTIIHSDGSVTNPEGSDFFASSYASIIDTAKFFYYDKDTLPQYFKNLKHIPELYDKIPGVLKTPFINREQVYMYDTILDTGITLPNNFDCYGQEFITWTLSNGDTWAAIDKIDNSIIAEYILDPTKNDKVTIDLYARFQSVGDYYEEQSSDYRKEKGLNNQPK